MPSDPAEPQINIDSREQLLYLLAEASEIEHNLMCCYLYAAWSLKDSVQEGVDEAELAAIDRWRRLTLSVAAEEMTHLTLVANLMTAIGGVAHISRPNFPVDAGRYPSGVVVKLSPFDRDTLQHFVYLERPEGREELDGVSFGPASTYVRDTVEDRCMPSAQDYKTVGHLYRACQAGVTRLVARIGEAGTFVGDPAAQITSSVARLPGLVCVTDLTSALAAIDTVVRQGEGSSTGGVDSHYARFLAMAGDYDRLLARNPNFTPHRPVATSPVMRRPPRPAGKVFVEAPDAAAVLDFANAAYGLMLRCVAQGFSRPGPRTEQGTLIDCALGLMHAIGPAGRLLTRLPAAANRPGVNAGMTFAMLRDVAALPHGTGEWAFVSERLGELSERAARLTAVDPRVAEAADAVRAAQAQFDGRVARLRQTSSAVAGGPDHAAPADSTSTASAAAAGPERFGPPAPTPTGDDEVVGGGRLTLRFSARRCIHSRMCVLTLPRVYRANAQGAWINPDAATAEANVAVALSCPSGAIRYERHDGGPAESAPAVNLLRLRENGPYALSAPLYLDGTFIGYRATFCRCGASQNKPFCDGSHVAAEFTATGEPQTGMFEPLPTRDGRLEITSLRNGPLAVSGNIEILSGTGRTIMKVTSTRLCRCGHSGTKPYCDGSHARVGFRS